MSFDRLAPFYRGMESVLAGGKLHRCRTAFLDQLPVPRRILILGEGPGRTLEECLRRFPSADILCVDLSAAMIEQARKRLPAIFPCGGRVRFLQADAADWHPPPDAFDAVITHFFLDCFRPEQLEFLIPSIARSLAPGGSWLIADFQVAGSGWKRWRSLAILWLMYRFFRCVADLPAARLTPPDPLLRRAGLARAGRIESEWGLLKSERWILPAQPSGTPQEGKFS